MTVVSSMLNSYTLQTKYSHEQTSMSAQQTTVKARVSGTRRCASTRRGLTTAHVQRRTSATDTITASVSASTQSIIAYHISMTIRSNALLCDLMLMHYESMISTRMSPSISTCMEGITSRSTISIIGTIGVAFNRYLSAATTYR